MTGMGRRRRRAGDADEVAFRIGEVPDCEVCAGVWLGAHHVLPAQALGLPQDGLHIGNAHVEQDARPVVAAAADPAVDASPVGRPVHEPVCARRGNLLGDRVSLAELPAEQLGIVVLEPRGIGPGDLEVHDRLSHVQSSLACGRSPTAAPRTTNGKAGSRHPRAGK